MAELHHGIAVDRLYQRMICRRGVISGNEEAGADSKIGLNDCGELRCIATHCGKGSKFQQCDVVLQQPAQLFRPLRNEAAGEICGM
jgi:hypothetical protein